MNEFEKTLFCLQENFTDLNGSDKQVALQRIKDCMEMMESQTIAQNSLTSDVYGSDWNGLNEDSFGGDMVQALYESLPKDEYSSSGPGTSYTPLEYDASNYDFTPFTADLGLELLQENYLRDFYPHASQNVGELPNDILDNEHQSTRKPRKCFRCTRSFRSRRRLFAHRKTHFPGRTVCTLCGVVLRRNSNYAVHLEERHHRPMCKVNVAEDSICEVDDDKICSHKCGSCGFEATGRKQLWRHGKSTGHTTKTSKNIPLFTCSNCDYKTEVKANLERHKQRKHSNVTFPCKLCPRFFKDEGSLKTHETTTHGGVIINCPECAKTFATHSNLTRHKRTVHALQRTFKCECGRSFQTGFHLKRHHANNCMRRLNNNTVKTDL